MARSRKNNQKNIKKQYQVLFPRQKDFPLDEIMEWLDVITVGHWHYINRKNDVIYIFDTLNDAFQFRMYFGEYIG